jgi:hypothetical protein
VGEGWLVVTGRSACNSPRIDTDGAQERDTGLLYAWPMIGGSCSHPDGCDRPLKTPNADWCPMHYQRIRINGEPGPSGMLREQPKLLCVVEGCERLQQKRDWCDLHYRRVMRDGAPGPAAVIKGGPPKRCSVNGCERRCVTRDGLCRMHDSRLRSAGDVGPAGLISDEPRSTRPCDVEGCEQKHYGRGLCRMHYRRAWEPNAYRKKPFGDPGDAKQLREPEPQPEHCEVDDCTNKARTHRLCNKHWRRFAVYGTTELVGIEEICRYCGSVFTFERKAATSGLAYCSAECRKFSNTQRARLRQAKVAAPFIDWRQVAERDGWTCGICGEPVDPDAPTRAPQSPSVDHIIALANGGEHSWKNVQLAHLGCNASKRDR